MLRGEVWLNLPRGSPDRPSSGGQGFLVEPGIVRGERQKGENKQNNVRMRVSRHGRGLVPPHHQPKTANAARSLGNNTRGYGFLAAEKGPRRNRAPRVLMENVTATHGHDRRKPAPKVLVPPH